MSIAAELAEDLILIGLALTWARWSKLDMGFRAPHGRSVWAWSLLCIIWIVLEETVASSVAPVATDTEWRQQQLEHLSLAEDLLLTVVISPIKEELLFRGVLFAALARRWGFSIAVVVPSILWALLHYQYEPWTIASIGISGVLLAIIRLRGGSLYVPIALHIAANLLDLVLAS